MPIQCLTGSGGPPLKSSVFQIGGLQLKLVVPSRSSRPTKAPSRSPQSTQTPAGKKGLGTGILDPETKSQSEMTTKSVPIYRSTESQSSDERALFLGPMRAMRSPLPIPLLIPSKYLLTRSPRARDLDAVCAPSASASELPMPYQFASGFSLCVYAASVSRQSEVAVDGHGFVEPTVVTCLVPTSANLTPLLRVSFPDFDLLPTSTL
ncbi:hypothetical protein FOYG_12638 [Fusarium oxysporum NRRL 32931]|uniref:Uncharacterized protein n=1 Tax=Fusarium oxysporum NRRL 32931 TaxID=660029 RepID=W9HZ53_FUSOX|nr:hypothetical protein FOYG_12638 [Fusarium oxysporum NRRL 32931]